MPKVLSNWYDKALAQPKWLNSSLLYDSVKLYRLKDTLNNEFNTLMDRHYLEEIYKLEMGLKFYVIFSANIDFYSALVWNKQWNRNSRWVHYIKTLKVF